MSLNYEFMKKASGTNHPALFSSTVITGQPHWIHSTPQELADGQSLNCKFRFQHTKELTTVTVVQEKTSNGLKVTLEHPLRSVTPGQYAVFYLGRECLGGARIIESPSDYRTASVQSDSHFVNKIANQ